MADLIVLLGVLLEVFAITILSCAFLKITFRKDKQDFVLFWIISSVLIYLFQLVTSLNAWTNFTTSFLIIVLIHFFIFRINILFTIISVLASFCIFLFAEFISLSILNYYFNIKTILGGTSIYRVIIALPHIIILLLLSIILIRFKFTFIPSNWLYSDRVNKKYRKHFQKYMSFTFITLLIIIVMIFTVSYSEFYKDNNTEAVFIVVAISTIYLLFFSQKILQNEAKKLEQHVDAEYQENINNYFKLIKSQRHDFIHHLNALYGLLSQNDIKNSKDYIFDILQDVKETNESLPLFHPALSAMLLTLKQKAQMNSIQMNIIVENSFEHLPCRISELNRVVGNIIENAIDALKISERDIKWIEVIFSSSLEDYTIMISNSSEIDEVIASKIFDDNFTTKHKHQGIGLAISKQIIENYNGFIYLEKGEDFTTFVVNIPFKESTNKGA